MNNCAKFIEYVKYGGSPVCSPQIGAGAGFDTKLAGKEWISETTLQDTIDAVQKFDIVPLINLGLCDLGEGNPELKWLSTGSPKNTDRIESEFVLKTPKGELRKVVVEEKFKGSFQTKYPVESVEDVDILEWYIDAAIQTDFSFLTEYVKNAVQQIDGCAALSVAWATQPYELLCFPDTMNTVLIANDIPQRFKSILNKILVLNEKLMNAVSAGGADFIFLGGPGSEMISPQYYEEFIIPYSQEVSAMAHSHGLLVYSHICSKLQPFLNMGFYGKMGIDLFETLSPPPVGNVEKLQDAFDNLNLDICTRGNIGLDILMNETPEIIQEKTQELIDASSGRKHMIAASDYLFYDIPEENLVAFIKAASV